MQGTTDHRRDLTEPGPDQPGHRQLGPAAREVTAIGRQLPVVIQSHGDPGSQPQALEALQQLGWGPGQRTVRHIGQAQFHARFQGQERITQQRQGDLHQGTWPLAIAAWRWGEQQPMRIMPEGFVEDLLEDHGDPWRTPQQLAELALAVEATRQCRLQPIERQAGMRRCSEIGEQFLVEMLEQHGVGRGQNRRSIGTRRTLRNTLHELSLFPWKKVKA